MECDIQCFVHTWGWPRSFPRCRSPRCRGTQYQYQSLLVEDTRLEYALEMDNEVTCTSALRDSRNVFTTCFNDVCPSFRIKTGTGTTVQGSDRVCFALCMCATGSPDWGVYTVQGTQNEMSTLRDPQHVPKDEHKAASVWFHDRYMLRSLGPTRCPGSGYEHHFATVSKRTVLLQTGYMSSNGSSSSLPVVALITTVHLGRRVGAI